MTDKEFRKMSRADLVQIIYRLQQREEELQGEIVSLNEQLNDRRCLIENAGSIADASLSLNRVMESAQAAADQYIEAVRTMCAGAEEKARTIIDDANQESVQIILKAKQEASEIRREAEEECSRLRVQTESDCYTMHDKILCILKEHSELKSLLSNVG